MVGRRLYFSSYICLTSFVSFDGALPQWECSSNPFHSHSSKKSAFDMSTASSGFTSASNYQDDRRDSHGRFVEMLAVLTGIVVFSFTIFWIRRGIRIRALNEQVSRNVKLKLLDHVLFAHHSRRHFNLICYISLSFLFQKIASGNFEGYTISRAGRLRPPPSTANFRKAKDEGLSKEKLDSVAPAYTGWDSPQPTLVFDGTLEKVGALVRFDAPGSPSDSSSDDCTICLEILTRGNSKRKLLCAHRYHADCIESWASKRNACPNCRQPIVADIPDNLAEDLREASQGTGQRIRSHSESVTSNTLAGRQESVRRADRSLSEAGGGNLESEDGAPAQNRSRAVPPFFDGSERSCMTAIGDSAADSKTEQTAAHQQQDRTVDGVSASTEEDTMSPFRINAQASLTQSSNSSLSRLSPMKARGSSVSKSSPTKSRTNAAKKKQTGKKNKSPVSSD